MSSTSEGSRRAAPRGGGKTGASTEALRELLKLGLDEDNAQAALDLVLETVKLRHGALLAYDGDRQSLTLLAQRNLAAEAKKALQKIQRGAIGSWDMPLHSLLQRRVYMIERPKENPFVPTLLEGTDQGVLTNLVFLPLYASGQASGMLLIAGSGTRAIREPDILALREPAKLLGVGLSQSEERRRRTAVTASAPPSPAYDRTSLIARITELEALVDSLRRTPAAAAISAEVERRLIETMRERDRLRAQLETNEIELVNLRSEITLLRDRGTGDTERSRKLAGELSRTKEQLAILADRERQAEEARERAERGRSELELRVQGLERRVAKSAEHAKETQSERATLSMRLAEAQAEVDELRRTLGNRDALLVDIRAERDRSSTALQEVVERARESQETLARLREDTEETVHQLRSDLDGLRAKYHALERERDQLRASASGGATVLEEIQRETESIHAELAREVERRRAAEDTSASVIRDAAALREDLERHERERATLESETARLRGETERLATELETYREGRSGLGESLRAVEARASDLEQRLTTAEGERNELDAELARLHAELDASRIRENESAARASSGEAERQKLRTEVDRIQSDLQAAREEAVATARERDASVERARSLGERIEALLHESETSRGERARTEEEAEHLRASLSQREDEIVRLRSEIELVRSDTQRLHEEMGSRETGEEAVAAVRHELEEQIRGLHKELENAQAHGSRLTEELESLRRSEEALRQTNTGLEAELRRQRERLHADQDERGRAAQDSIARLESALQIERTAVRQAREQAESERRAAAELAAHVEELQRHLHDAEADAESRERRATELAEAAAIETSRSLAVDLGRRTAEVEELGERLRAREREMAESQSEREQALERIRALEETAKSSASEVASLRRQLALAEDEKTHLLQDQDLRFAELQAHAARLEEQIGESTEERERLLTRVREIETAAAEREETLREAADRGGEVDTAVAEARVQTERLRSELDSVRGQVTTLEGELRTAKADVGKWQNLHEKLQRALAERDRDLQGLRGAIAALRKRTGAAEEAAPPPPAAEPAAPRSPTEPAPELAEASSEPSPAMEPPSRTVYIFDEQGPSLDSLSEICREAGFEPHLVTNGEPASATPGLIAVNLLAEAPAGLEAIWRVRRDSGLRLRPIVLYAAKPGSPKGVVLPKIDCLVRPVEEADFSRALSALIGRGKRVTIIGEDLDSVLRFNGWASSSGCTVSSAGDLKQGSDLLEIVKPDLIILDFPRLSGEGAGLIVKVRRTARLTALPVLLMLPEPPSTPATALFLKRLTALAEETDLDLTPVGERLRSEAPATE